MAINKCLKCLGVVMGSIECSDGQWEYATFNRQTDVHYVVIEKELRAGRYAYSTIFAARTKCGVKFEKEVDHGD